MLTYRRDTSLDGAQRLEVRWISTKIAVSGLTTNALRLLGAHQHIARFAVTALVVTVS